jgi:acyl transferase domain-containing protein
VERLAGSQTGVFVGAPSHSADYWLLQLAQSADFKVATTGSAHSILANRISYLLDLRGPSLTVDTACSSSLVAVHLACQSLRTGECDLALAGGVNLLLLPATNFGFAKLEVLSTGGCCRAFDDGADGIARGEGCVAVLLKRLADAVRECDPILAVIRGSAVNQDGAQRALRPTALRRKPWSAAPPAGGVPPERIGMVETHGTGTSWRPSRGGGARERARAAARRSTGAISAR